MTPNPKGRTSSLLSFPHPDKQGPDRGGSAPAPPQGDSIPLTSCSANRFSHGEKRFADQGCRGWRSPAGMWGGAPRSGALCDDDLETLARQAEVSGKGRGRNFTPEIVAGIARRCAHGCPQVLLCEPMRGGAPFPTSFWLVCPHLNTLLGRLEGENGVAGMEASLAGREAAWRAYHRAHAVLRLSLLPAAKRAFLRRYRRPLYRALRRGGIGGIDYIGGGLYAKCLHLQTASFLALGRHPAEDWLRAAVTEWSCAAGTCAKR